MRALVTGGAGFVGSHLVDRLLEDGHVLLVVDDLSTGRRDQVPEGCGFAELDITSDGLVPLVEDFRPEVVLHLAAQMDVRKSVADPLFDTRTNVLGTVNVLEACVRAGVPRVVFASSGGTVYGTPPKLPASERMTLHPASPYGSAKAAGETYVAAYQRLHGLAGCSLRLGNVYGPRQDPHGEAGVVGIFAAALAEGRPTTVYGDGTSSRDYVYVDDVVDALVRAAARGRTGARYNIGTGRQTADADLHALVAKTVGVPDEPEHAPARLGDVRATALDAFKAYRELGWAPRTSLVEGVRRTVEHFAQPAEARWEAPELDAADPGSTTEPA